MSKLADQKKQDTKLDGIPWPVKSGKRADVTDSAVKTFFRKAPPNADSPELMFKVMRAECLKWHSDKSKQLFGDGILSDADKIIFDMICRVVLELRREAQSQRKP